MFKINFKYLIQLLLPPILRQPKQLAWLQLIISQIKRIYDEFQELRAQWQFDVNFTGQIYYLERKLKTINLRISIADGVNISTEYVFNIGESYLPIYCSNLEDNLPTINLINKNEISVIYDFIIYTPDLNLSDKIDKIVAKYKLYDKTYKIQLI